MIISIGGSIFDIGYFNVIKHWCIDDYYCEVGIRVMSYFWGWVEGMVKEGGQKVSEEICVVVVGWDDVLWLTDTLFGVYCLLMIGKYHRGFYVLCRFYKHLVHGVVGFYTGMFWRVWFVCFGVNFISPAMMLVASFFLLKLARLIRKYSYLWPLILRLKFCKFFT